MFWRSLGERLEFEGRLHFGSYAVANIANQLCSEDPWFRVYRV